MADAISVAPNNYRVLLENDRVRLLEYRGKPGDKAEMHSHPDTIAYGLTDIKARFAFPDGQTMDIEIKAGEAMFNNAFTHTVENTGNSEGRVLLVELK